jgi:hypothetical protein
VALRGFHLLAASRRRSDFRSAPIPSPVVGRAGRDQQRKILQPLT